MTVADPNALERCLETVVERLDESMPDPADIEKGVVLPILQSLGWDVFNPKAVKSRIRVSGANLSSAAFCPLRDVPACRWLSLPTVPPGACTWRKRTRIRRFPYSN